MFKKFRTPRPLSHRAVFHSGLAALMLVTIGLTAGCTMWREEAATRLATPAQMVKRQIDAGTMNLAAYERIHQRGGVATIYIEGDGMMMPYTDENIVSVFAPTPSHPTALHLATRDKGNNVIYLARPCQYVTAKDNPACDKSGWADERFSVENLDAMDMALDDIERRYGFTGFHLVGYEGGGQMAILLAAIRDDVLTVRTVASTLDHQSWTAMNRIYTMDGSLNAADFAQDVAHVPQHHFLGAWDDLITLYNYNSFRGAMGPSTCVRMSQIDGANDRDGWVNRWPSLLALPVDCNSDQ